MHELKTEPASVSGEASVIRAHELKSQPAVLQGVITIIRAGTGKVETFNFTGTPVSEKDEQQ